MKYYSEITNAVYETEQELRDAEMAIARKEAEKKEMETVMDLCNGNDVLADMYTTNMKVQMIVAITGDTDHGPIKARMVDGSIKTYGNLYEVMYDLKKRELEIEKEKQECDAGCDEEDWDDEWDDCDDEEE